MPSDEKRDSKGRLRGRYKGNSHFSELVRLGLRAKKGENKALIRLLDILQNGANMESIQAAKLLMQYGYGKAPETVNINVDDETTSKLEMIARLAKLPSRELDEKIQEAESLVH